jgi:hypothetical protein
MKRGDVSKNRVFAKTLQTRPPGRSGVITYQEIEENGTWKPRKWERCGTFLCRYKIDPGKTAEIRVYVLWRFRARAAA